MGSMRIAQIAPLYESCPPRFYGGTERVVSYLTEELVRHGHEVTLFASGDSMTTAVLEPGCGRALRLDASCQDPLVYHLAMLHRVRERGREFDILHFHTDYLHFPLFADICGQDADDPAWPARPARSAADDAPVRRTCRWCRFQMRSGAR